MKTVTITWNDSITADVTEYKIYRNEVLIATVSPGVETYDDPTAQDATTYKYEVQAVNPFGETTEEVEGNNMAYITTS